MSASKVIKHYFSLLFQATFFHSSGLFFFVLCFSSLLLSGCSNIQHAQSQNALQEIDSSALLFQSLSTTKNFGAKPEIQTQQEIHALPEAIAADFLAYMAAPGNAYVNENERMYHYLSRTIDDFVYEGQTFTAAETALFNGGNCMSLAVLTTAFADLAGLDIDYQLMDDVPVYEFNDTLVKKGLHIRSRIYEPNDSSEQAKANFFRSKIVIDYFPTRRHRFISNLDRNDYMAMYFQNLAVEALDSEQLNTAYWYAMEALQYVTDNASALNTLAIINRRAGYLETAEKIYRHGIEHADDKLSLMKNYAVLLQSSERLEEARIIQAKIDLQDDPSPHHWFQLAKTTFENAEYIEAIKYYQRALSSAPYLHEAYLGIALANYELGEFNSSRTALQSAVAEADRISTRNLYQAKLSALVENTEI